MASKERQLERLYRRLPRIACQGRCHISCGPIPMTQLEKQRIVKAAGRAPKFELKTLHCSMLTPENRCGAYEQRPLICRLYGVVPQLACPFGCQPERWLEDADVHKLLLEIMRIGGPLVFSDQSPNRQRDPRNSLSS